MFDVESFYKNYNINYYPGDYPHKHCRPGWIQTECPRCSGNPGVHLGFCETSGQFVCWRCGYVPLLEAIRLFVGCSWIQAKAIAKEYGGFTRTKHRYIKAPKEKDIDVYFPQGILKFFPKRHKTYLEGRNFDTDRLIDIWGLKATGKLGEYHNRIIAPIYYKNKLMSYQGRTIIKDKTKYKACEHENERRHHKYCLYGLDMIVGKSVIVTEGITDVWRLGIGAVCTFGIKYTEVQVMLLYKNFKRIFVLFDETEEEAQNKARELTNQLSTMGRSAEHITLGINHDPGDLDNDSAKYLMRELLIK